MKHFGAALPFVLMFAVPAAAAELPARKAGLWEMTTTVAGHGVSMRQCIDARTDQAMPAGAGPAAQRNCSRRDVRTSGDTITFDSVCTVAGETRTSHAVVTGSFDSGYTMTVSGEGEGPAAARTVTITAKWLGPCAADQRPGDLIMPNGMKMNILDLQNGMRAPGMPGAPGAPPSR